MSKIEQPDVFPDHKFGICFSFALTGFAFYSLRGMVNSNAFYFWENLTPVGTALTTLAFVIYGVWDAINDPLMGFISDKPTRLSKKYGRRYPWVIFCVFPMIFSLILIFWNPTQNQIVSFFWMLVVICAYELLNTIVVVNSNAIWPDKFRSNRDRKRITFWHSLFIAPGTLAGMMVPALLINYTGTPAEQKTSYLTAAIIIAGITLVFGLLMLPGLKDDQDMIDRVNAMPVEERKALHFFKVIKHLVKNRNFMAYTIVGLALAALSQAAIVSIPYVVNYVLHLDKDFEMVLQIGYLGGMFVSIPFWSVLRSKWHYTNLYKAGTLLIPLCLIPTMFISNIWIMGVFAVGIGFGVGAAEIHGQRLYLDIIDEACLDLKERKEGAYAGIYTLIGRLGPIIGTFIVGTTHRLTGYVEGAVTQSPTAVFGIKLHFALIPSIAALIGYFIFLVLYNLNAKRVREVQEQLKALNL